MRTRLTIYKDAQDISDEVSLENHKSNPFGWSQAEIHYNGERIGWLESGQPMDFIEGFSFSVTQES